MVIKSRADDLLSSVELSPPEVAYLAEGVPRAIGATLAGLAQMGVVKFRSDRKVVPMTPAPPGLEDPIQQSVIRFMSKAEQPRSVEDIRIYAEPATEPVRDALRASGLLLNERALWTGGLAIAIGGVMAYVGILVLTALHGGNAVVWGFVVTLIPTLYLIGRRRRTRRGNAVLNRLQEERVALKETAQHAPTLLTPTDLALAVAIYGSAILEGGPLNDIGYALKRERNNRGSCGGCGACGGCGCGGCGGCA